MDRTSVMTAFDYSRMLESANRLMAKFGQTGAVRRPGTPTGPSYDPTPGSPTDDPARFVITAYEARDVDGTRILATDKKALVAPGSLTSAPALSDKLVEADGTAWNIVNVETLRPAETTLLWTVQIRR